MILFLTLLCTNVIGTQIIAKESKTYTDFASLLTAIGMKLIIWTRSFIYPKFVQLDVHHQILNHFSSHGNSLSLYHYMNTTSISNFTGNFLLAEDNSVMSFQRRYICYILKEARGHDYQMKLTDVDGLDTSYVYWVHEHLNKTIKHWIFDAARKAIESGFRSHLVDGAMRKHSMYNAGLEECVGTDSSDSFESNLRQIGLGDLEVLFKGTAFIYSAALIMCVAEREFEWLTLIAMVFFYTFKRVARVLRKNVRKLRRRLHIC